MAARYFISKEIFQTKVDNQIKNYVSFIETAKTIIPAIKNFDGKVVNVKLEREIYKSIENLETEFQVIVTWTYIKFLTRKKTFLESDIDVDMELDGKRLKAEETIKNIENTIQRTETKINEVKELMQNFDIYQQKTEEIEKIIEQYEKDVPYILRPYLSISTKTI